MMNNTDRGIPEPQAFGRWRFDINTGDLFDGTSTTRLEPQVAKLLAFFLVHQNTLISRDELISAVWQDRTVSDDAINRCVSILRQLLTPDNKNAYIETVVRRGFISHFPDASSETASATQPARSRKILVLASLVGIFAVLLYGVVGHQMEKFRAIPPALREGPPTIAVLPFTASDMTGDSGFFANGMHDDLLTQLAQLQSIKVISRTSVLEYRDTTHNIRKIGQELGADVVLEGSVQRVGDQIRINAQLIDARTDEHLWAQSYDRELLPANIFAVQAEITQAIAAALKTTLTEQEASQLAVLPTQNMAAYRAYHQAMEIRDTKGVSSPEYVALLEEAVTLDPTFVRAWAELAGLLSFGNFSQTDSGSIGRVEEILEQIQSVAPQSADLLIAQTYYTYYVLKDYEQAYALVKQAQIQRPNDERVAELKSWIERRLGDYEARIASVRLARTLDPRNPVWTRILVINLILIHEYDQASREIENSAFQNAELSALRSKLQLREDQDFDRWTEALESLEQEYGVAADPQDLWDSYIARRDYAAAEQWLPAPQAASQSQFDWALEANFRIQKISTFWFLRSSGSLEPLLVQERAYLAEIQNPDGNFPDNDVNLVMAYITAAEGNREDTKRSIRVWQREAVKDRASLAVRLHYACRALGMAAATADAVDCIRSGLAMPSFVMPFIEPHMPYYDSIRNQPEFIELLADIQASTQL